MRFITRKQAKYITDNFFEFGFKDPEIEPTYEQFKKIETPGQLHYLAQIYNWDDGIKVLNWIIDSPKCSKATALLLFWRSEPDYYTRFNFAEEADHDAEVFSLVRKILKNYQAGFYRHRGLGFDPASDGADTSYRDKNEKWPIPDSIKKPIRGGLVFTI